MMTFSYSKNILIVDDNLYIREMLKIIIEGFDFYASTARDAEEAFNLLRKKFFDVAIVNYEMSGMTGKEFIRYLKENHFYLKVWGMGFADKKEDFYKTGADFFIEKPFNLLKLRKLLNNYLELTLA